MNYLKLSEHGSYWMFSIEDLEVEAGDQERIRPLCEPDAIEFWSKYISKKNRHPMVLDDDDWLRAKGVLKAIGNWQDQWNSDDAEIPQDLEANVCWDHRDVVYFAYDKSVVIETTWAVFKRNWKNFLFDDEGPFLICPARSEIVAFAPSGLMEIAKMR